MKLYNTLKRRKEEFVPINDNEVRMYTCGPTVYDLSHIGNFCTFVFEDVLRRYLELLGFEVVQVMNITDIDDKTIDGARWEGVSLGEYTERYTKAFFEDLDLLGIERAEYYPRATEHIQDMINMVSDLLHHGHAYEKDGSVYFDISSFRKYGMLSGRDVDKTRGIIDNDEYEEGDARDFALWKAHKEGEPQWEAPFGPGRPGWHIECSAMSMKYLGESFDIHTGGTDNIFPHHENELAQSEAYTGKRFVSYWLHGELLLVDGEKMAKSKGNFYTLRDLIGKGYDTKAVRFLLASSYYRHPLNFTLEGLDGASSTIRRIRDFRERALDCDQESEPGMVRDIIARGRENFFLGMDDDLNCPRALGGFFEAVRDVNRVLDSGKGLENSEKDDLLALITDVNKVFDFLPEEGETLPEEIEKMIGEREQARAQKDYSRADELREKIASQGFHLEDTPGGVKWRKVPNISRGS